MIYWLCEMRPREWLWVQLGTQATAEVAGLCHGGVMQRAPGRGMLR